MPSKLTEDILARVKKGQTLFAGSYKDSKGNLRPFTQMELGFEKGKPMTLDNLVLQIMYMSNMSNATYSSSSTISYSHSLDIQEKLPHIKAAIQKRFKNLNLSIDGATANLKVNYENREKTRSEDYYWKFDLDIDVNVIP